LARPFQHIIGDTHLPIEVRQDKSKTRQKLHSGDTEIADYPIAAAKPAGSGARIIVRADGRVSNTALKCGIDTAVEIKHRKSGKVFH